jgi:adenylate kinase
MPKPPFTFLVFGRSGCGKGTQAKLLMKYFGIKLYVSSGDLFRDLAKKKTVVGKMVDKIITVGGLPPNWLAEYLWSKALVENLKSEKEGIVFDGLARRLPEAKKLLEAMNWLGRKLTVILIDVSRREAFRRLKARGRKDDTDAKINARLDWYETETMKSVRFFQKKGVLLKIDGMPPPEAVFQNILKALKEQ